MMQTESNGKFIVGLLLSGSLLGLVFLSQSCVEDDGMRVLVLGNSITHHGPLPSIGWNGDWGMAASVADSDFVHVLERRLKTRYGDVRLEATNIADWEMDFTHDFSREPLLNFRPHVLVVRLGENVKTTVGYRESLEKLIRQFGGNKVIVTSAFWVDSANVAKDSVAVKVTRAHGYSFVRLSDLCYDRSNMAYATYEGGVGAHPSDQGMRLIAIRIDEEIARILK